MLRMCSALSEIEFTAEVAADGFRLGCEAIACCNWWIVQDERLGIEPTQATIQLAWGWPCSMMYAITRGIVKSPLSDVDLPENALSPSRACMS
jgi:hypothetical protein